MDVSIIIVNYNTKKLLIDCIESIIEKTFDINYEIIVVDNNSPESPKNDLLRLFPNLIYYQSLSNVGFGNANNLGVTISTGKYLLFLNSDTLLINNAVKIFFDFWQNNSDMGIGALGGNLFHDNLSPNFSYAAHFPSLKAIIYYRARFYKFFNLDFFNDTGVIKKVAFVIGADLFITKDLFINVGGFDPKIFMYNEDCDLQYQLSKYNLNIFNLPDAKIIHKQGSSSTSKQKLIMEVTSYNYFFNKNFNRTTSFFYLIIELIFSFIFFVFGIVLFKKRLINNYSNLFIYIIKSFLKLLNYPPIIKFL